MIILLGTEIFYPYLYGGGEVFAYHVSRNLVKLGHEVHVICPRGAREEYNDTLPVPAEVDGVRIHAVPGEFRYGTGLQSTTYLLRMYREASRVVKEIQPHVANAQIFRPCLPLLLAARSARIPCVATVFDTYSRGSCLGLENWLRIYGRLGVLGWALEKTILRLPFDSVITNSNAVKHKITPHLTTKRVEVVNCGVDIEHYPKTYPKKIRGRILYLGRLVPYKNLNHLLKAYQIVKGKQPDVSLMILGSGPQRSFIERMAARRSDIQFIPSPDESEKIRLLREAEVLVLPSSEEGFGIILLEANAAYTPFVSYDIPAVREVAAFTKGGLLSPHMNFEHLAGAILMLLKDKRRARAMAEAGRRSVQQSRFSWDSVTKRVLRIYELAIARNDVTARRRS